MQRIACIILVLLASFAASHLHAQSSDSILLELDREAVTKADYRFIIESDPNGDLTPLAKAILEADTLDKDVAMGRFESLYESYKADGHNMGMLIASKIISARHMSLKEVDKGKPYCMQCLELSKDVSPSIFGHCLLNYSIERRFLQDFDSAFILLDSALRHFKRHNLMRGQAYSLLNIGSTFHYQDMLDSAMQNYLKALPMFETLNDSALLGKAHNNLGIISLSMRDTKKARHYHQKSLMYKDPSIPSNSIAISYTSLGNLQLALGQWDSASYYFRQALRITKKLKDELFMLKSHNNLANAAYYVGDYQAAYHHFDSSLSLTVSVNDSLEMSRLNSNMGWSLISLERVDEALAYFEKGLQIAESIESLEAREIAYSGLSDYYLAKEDFEKALTNYSKSRDIADEILNIGRVEQLNEMQTRYETEKKENEINRLDKANAEAELLLSQQRLWLAIALIVLLLSGAAGFFVFYRSRQQQKAALTQKELAYRQKLLEVTVSTQENERQRIAKDLHDGLVQQLVVVKMNMQAISKKLGLSGDDEKEFARKLSLIDDAANDARTISHQMMPRALMESGLVTALDDMLEKTLSAYNITFQFEHFGLEDLTIKKNIEIGLYRICQEMVNNIIKHSKAGHVEIQLYRAKGFLILHIEDDGVGFDINSGEEASGIGLNSIFSRASAVNGEVNYESGKGKGTAANVRVPLD